jgi:large subunit ribosomal protein L24
MSKLHIKKGDKVKVLAGESKGEEGRIIKVYPAKNTAIVEGDGIKKAKKHTKPKA